MFNHDARVERVDGHALPPRAHGGLKPPIEQRAALVHAVEVPLTDADRLVGGGRWGGGEGDLDARVVARMWGCVGCV